MDEALFREAVRCGASTVLTGSGGDAVAALPIELALATLLRAGSFPQAWRVARPFGQATSQSPLLLLRRAMGELIPLGLRSGLFTALRGGFADWEHQTDSTIPPWIRRSFGAASE